MTPVVWPALVPELICGDLDKSRHFYCALIGFRVRFERPEDGFIYLEMGRVALMIEQECAERWITAPLDRPLGRGMNLQIEVDDVLAITARLRAAGVALYREPKEQWYRRDELEHGQVEVLVQDPDGYLLRFVQVIGSRLATSA